MAPIPGVDYAWTHPGGKAIAAKGYKFACRYSSNDTKGKDLSRTEADDLAANGVWSVVVRETTANRARAGRAAGIADAKAAVADATACGMPSSRPLYFAIDYDAPVADRAAIQEYFRGVASVIGVARTGGYGGYDQLKWLADGKLIRWVWQTAAWSRGRLLPSRNIYQYAKTVTINGVSCDVNEALTADYGQWMPGKAPVNGEDDMAEWTDKLLIKKGPWTDKDQSASASDVLWGANLKADVAAQHGADAVAALKTQATEIAAIKTALGKVQAPVIDYAKLAAALLTAIKEGS